LFGFGIAVLKLLFAISRRRGAAPVAALATSPEFTSVSGAYLYRARQAAPSPAAQDDDAARRLWEVAGMAG